MNKQHIIEEIIRTAKENNGIPLGKSRFETETGIKYCDWHGKYLGKWNDAIKEADLMPNKMTTAYDENWLRKIHRIHGGRCVVCAKKSVGILAGEVKVSQVQLG